MKKVLFVKFLAVFFTLMYVTGGVYAQDEAFDKGDMVINAGVGLGTYTGWAGYSTKIPYISGTFEYCLFEMFKDRAAIGVGGYTAYSSSKYKGKEEWGYSNFIVGGKLFLHYQFIEKLDTYLGFMFGYDIVSYGHKDANLGGSAFISAQTIGARYYFSKNFALFGEVGYGVTPLEVGIAFKF